MFDSTLNQNTNKGRMSKKVNMNFRSNSLSDIESINSEAEHEKTNGHISNSQAGKSISRRTLANPSDSACLNNEDNESYQRSFVDSDNNNITQKEKTPS